MGVVTGLLLLPVSGPLRAFRFFLERIHEEAEGILRDEGRAFAELIDLSMRHAAGQLSEAEYVEQEAKLLEQLTAIREYRDELLYAESDEHEYEDEYQYDDAWIEPDYAEAQEEEQWL